MEKATDDSSGKTPEKQQESLAEQKKQEDFEMAPENQETPTEGENQDAEMASLLSEKRKALFEPLEPITNINGKRPSAESLLPPPDFDSASYPRGWLIGKKRKLVNVDVVESMRRIAIQEMNRKVLQSLLSLIMPLIDYTVTKWVFNLYPLNLLYSQHFNSFKCSFCCRKPCRSISC